MASVSLDIDPQVLESLREIQGAEKRPLDQIVSDLLADALQQRVPLSCWEALTDV